LAAHISLHKSPEKAEPAAKQVRKEKPS